MKKTIAYIIESIIELKQILFGDKESTKDTICGVLLFVGFIGLWILTACVAR